MMRLFRLFRKISFFLFLVFVLPALVSLAVWEADASKPKTWSEADWSSAGILPNASESSDAAIYLMVAKTGRWKGAFSVHSWILVKKPGASRYDRYEVVGWGRPLRKNAYAPDARWYSNEPEIVYSLLGQEAARHIEKIESIIVRYPEAEYGDYVVWPGPNSNTFIAYLLNELPELGWVLPSNAIGRDWPQHASWLKIDPDFRNFQLSLNGFAGVAIGARHGFELNFLGLVAGVDIMHPGIKVPGFGTVRF